MDQKSDPDTGKEALMLLKTYCAMDLHHSHTVIEAQSARGAVRLQRDVPTEPGPLIEAVKAVPGPKGMVIEEGPMADWAMRVIKPYVLEVIVCDPRRNRLVSDDGDKTDVVAAGKLVELYRMGSLRSVHHPTRLSMMDLRSWVWAYHDQVALVTAAKNKIKAVLRMGGVQYGNQNVYAPRTRKEWLGKLSRRSARVHRGIRYGNLGDLQRRRDRLYHGEIRSVSFVEIVDSPFRFMRPSKLWRYGGVGLEERQSGDPQRGRKRPGKHYHRRLKEVAKGAAETALSLGDKNPFQVIYQRLLRKGLKEPLARLTVARKMLSVPWGMWKGGTEYDPALVT